MTKERIAELKEYLRTFEGGFAFAALEECLDEIERLQAQLEEYHKLRYDLIKRLTCA